MKITSSYESCATELPSLLSFSDGSPVVETSDWSKRRKEISKIIFTEEYGIMPPLSPTPPRFRETRTPGSSRGHESAQYSMFPFDDSDSTVTVDIYLPTDAKRPVPAIITGDGCWTHTVTNDTISAVVSRGFALVSFNRCQVVPDFWHVDQTQKWASELMSRWPGHENIPPKRESPLQLRFPSLDFGAVAAWAWGFSRVYDMLSCLPYIDASRICVTGHSRGGKAALLAGANDTRFAAVSSNGSGSAGAACWRFAGNKTQEKIRGLTTNFPTWLSHSMLKWIDKEDSLPFDQHFLKAMVAPRPLIVTEAIDDEWANPEGSRITNIAVTKVYNLLGADAEKLVAYHIRPGAHAQTSDDWAVITDFFKTSLF